MYEDDFTLLQQEGVGSLESYDVLHSLTERMCSENKNILNRVLRYWRIISSCMTIKEENLTKIAAFFFFLLLEIPVVGEKAFEDRTALPEGDIGFRKCCLLLSR